MVKVNERAASLATIARSAGREVDPGACRWKYAATKMEVDEGNQEVVSVINTDSVDQDREVVLPEGANVAPFERLKSVYYNHDYGELPVGALRKLQFKESASVWRMRYKPSKTTFGGDVYRLIQDGAINGMSIGFESVDSGPPTEGEIAKYGKIKRIHRTWNLFEVSVTPMPCNPDAMIESRSTDPDPEWCDRLERALRTRRIARKSAHLMGLPERARTVVVIERPSICVV